MTLLKTFKSPFYFMLVALAVIGTSAYSQLYVQDSIKLEGLVLHMQIYNRGAGDPVLLINGGPGMNSRGFEEVALHLSRNNEVIIYDQRGTGESVMNDLSPSTLSMDLMVADMEAIRKHLSHEEWILMGHSFGGMLAWYYSFKHPQRVKAMIQSHSGGYNLDLLDSSDAILLEEKLDEQMLDSLHYWRSRIVGGDSSLHARQKRAEFLAPAYVYDDRLAPALAARLMQSDMQINRLIWQDMRRIGFDCEASLRSFEKPVLIIHGQNDIVNPRLARNAHALLPQSELHILEGCGHYGWLDREETYFSTIRRFLTINPIKVKGEK